MPLMDEVRALVASYPFVALIAGFTGLIWSADRFVTAAAAAAKNLGVSNIVIGLTFVAVGTSAPEIMVGLRACMREGGGDLAIGNAIGSNIANIGLVLGVTALVRELPFTTQTLKREMPWLIGATLLALVCLFSGSHLGVADGVLLLAGCSTSFTGWPRLVAKVAPAPLPTDIQSEIDDLRQMPMLQATVWFCLGPRGVAVFGGRAG